MFPAKDIWFSEIKQKNKLEKLNDALIYSNNKISKYSTIYQKQTGSLKENSPELKYIFIPKSLEGIREHIQKDLIQEWGKHIRTNSLRKVIKRVKTFIDKHLQP